MSTTCVVGFTRTIAPSLRDALGRVPSHVDLRQAGQPKTLTRAGTGGFGSHEQTRLFFGHNVTLTNPYSEMVVPRAAVTLPLRVPEPPGFDPERLETWPEVSGRLEYIEGALWYMPPCGDDQQYTTADVVTVLGNWRRQHPDFVVGTNEAGMKLGGDVRGADAAVWRKADVGARTGGVQRVPPVLAVEVAGIDDTIELLRDKAQWYLAHGVEVVWLLVPDERVAEVITASGELSFGPQDSLPAHASLPDLRPRVADLFQQIDER